MAEVDKSEKITINVGLVDLGQIDLLVDEGFYANRTDFIRTAIRRQLETRAGAVEETVARRTLTLGTQHLTRQDLVELRTAGRTVELRVLGLATIAVDTAGAPAFGGPRIVDLRLDLARSLMDDIAAGTFSLDQATREYVRAQLGFRMIRVCDVREALQVERMIRRGGLAEGRPLLNPLT